MFNVRNQYYTIDQLKCPNLISAESVNSDQQQQQQQGQNNNGNASHYNRSNGSIIRDIYKLPHTRKAQKNCGLIKHIAKCIGFPIRTVCTAQLVNYKVYSNQEAKTYSSMHLAICCLFVASKMEETIKKLRDIITQAYMIERGESNISIVDTNLVEKIRVSVMGCEQFILDSIGFDFRTTQAHRLLIKIAKRIGAPKDVAKVAWFAFIDCYQTLLPLQYPPIILITASIFLAVNLSRIRESKAPLGLFQNAVENLNHIGSNTPSIGEQNKPTESIPPSSGEEDMDIEDSTTGTPSAPKEECTESGGPEGNSDDGKKGKEDNGVVISKEQIMKIDGLDSNWWKTFGLQDSEVQDSLQQLMAFYVYSHYNLKPNQTEKSDSKRPPQLQTELGKPSVELSRQVYEIIYNKKL